MNSRLPISLLKLILFTLPLFFVSVALKGLFPGAGLSDHIRPQTGNLAFYFLGTSRTRGSIATDVLTSQFNECEFVNLAIPNCSILYSLEVASNLLQHVPGQKVIFIELTDYILLPPDDSHLIMSRSDEHAAMANYLLAGISPQDVSALVYYTFSIKNDLKRIFSVRVRQAGSETPFQSSASALMARQPAILTPETLTLTTAMRVNQDVFSEYKHSIERLEQLAKQTGTEVIFFLPLAIPKQNELEIDLPVFEWLPAEKKWEYSSQFLASMNDPKYFADASHLNQAGESQYTLELSKFIEARFRITRKQ
jgi:hypothetical protein